MLCFRGGFLNVIGHLCRLTVSIIERVNQLLLPELIFLLFRILYFISPIQLILSIHQKAHSFLSLMNLILQVFMPDFQFKLLSGRLRAFFDCFSNILLILTELS